MHAFNESYDSLGTLGTKSEGALSKGIKLALNIQKASYTLSLIR